MKKRSLLSGLLVALLVIAASCAVYRYRYAILEQLYIWVSRIRRKLGLAEREDYDEEIL